MRLSMVLALLAGCGEGLRDDRFPTGSTTIVSTRHADALVTVNVDEGTVSRLDRATGKVDETAVGLEPTRIARVDDTYWVTLRGERGVAVLRETDRALVLEDVLPAGNEPHGVVATENGRRVYVANAMSDTVVEYDGRSREALRTFAVQDEPRWLALNPNDRVLYVATARGGALQAIDLATGRVSRIPLPPTVRFDPQLLPIDLDVRVTGDPAVAPDGRTLGVPVLYADTTSSVDDPTSDEPVVEGYGSIGLGVGRMNPALVTVPLGDDGQASGDATAIFLASVANTEAKEATEATEATEDGGATALRSYASSVTASPSSDEWVVTMEASNAVLVVDADLPGNPMGTGGGTAVGVAVDGGPTDPTSTAIDTDGTGGSEPVFPFTAPTQAGFVTHASAIVATAAGPRGVVFLDDEEARVHTFLDRAVEDLRFDEAEEAVDDLDRGEFTVNLFEARGFTQVASSSLDPDTEAGRRMFYSAVDGRMAADGAGVSCATCHFGGRDDGFTWTLQGEERNTPSLAGPVQQTAPVTWSEGVESVAEEAMLTSALRMGGAGLTDAEALQIQAFVQAGRYPDAPRAGDDGPLVALGREVFLRTDTGCGTCHGGDLFTDNQSHLVLGSKATQTPTLRGVAASAPYLHDGSAPTLRVVVEWARSGQMGDTSSLSDHEVDALVAYLESL